MSRDSILVMLLAAQFFAPFLLALLFSRRSRTSPAESSGHMAPKGVTGKDMAKKDMAKKSMAPPQHGDWPLITEFAYRRDYFRRWVIAGAFGSVVLGLAGMYLSVIGVLFLCPLYGALMHLRCPGCDATTTVKGVTDGNYCRRCGQLLRL